MGGPRADQGLKCLRARFEEAISASSGIQQPGGSDEECIQGQLDIENAIRDIAAALTGKEISFGEKLPYPPPEKDYHNQNDYMEKEKKLDNLDFSMKGPHCEKYS